MPKWTSLIVVALFLFGCSEKAEYKVIERESKIPSDAVKFTPEMDGFPPKLHSDEYTEPVPLEGPVNTAGAEDSPFMDPITGELYFFFTPDVRVPPEKQVIDGVTGIYRTNDGVVERVNLQDPGKLALDGCAFIKGDEMLFCGAREGYTGLHWFSAERTDGEWSSWKLADFNSEHEVGELHISSDGSELYFHSSKAGGKGGTDIWVSKRTGGRWNTPENLEVVNTKENEGMPFLTGNGEELWFNRFYMGTPAVFRSKRVNGELSEPELIISQFAGEPTLDKQGNIYFVHHFYKDGSMIEADIYVAHRK